MPSPTPPKNNNTPISLLCTLHPTSPASQTRLLALLRRSSRSYYRQPSANCTTWSYFTPAVSKSSKTSTSTSTANPEASSAPLPTIMGLEMYASKTALQAQVDDEEFFQPYHRVVREEGLYAKAEELVAWELAGGFVSRGTGVQEGGGGTLVTVTRMTAKESRKDGTGRGALETVLEQESDFAAWVRDHEPEVPTYALFTRARAPREVLVFVRYRDGKALRGHDECEAHQAVIRKLKGLTEKVQTTVWREVEDSFVGGVGGSGLRGEAKL